MFHCGVDYEMTVSSDVETGEGGRGNRVYYNLKVQVIFEMFIE